MTTTKQQTQRLRMVEQQLRPRGIRNARVLRAMGDVPRHCFVPEALQAEAYEDTPLPIGAQQTISQPYIVARMTEAAHLTPQDKVLEIGTGSGYQTAVLSNLVQEVYSIEIIPDLAQRAQRTLEALGYRNVQLRVGDGHQGWPEAAPFDAILVTSAPPELPIALLEQLKPNGRMVIPIGLERQDLRVYWRSPEGIHHTSLLPVQFVPMKGQIR
ncbi:protein-L-isoaspartate(D-aspartate) O-methyltransferase [Lyngbya confervoides]|uniref:Protein-L-isoaspartate O-methyltransferase n=1 Tax=Lyngbya confervoides BDU141951 TaxID=1574623 RepID=A0ABD4T7S6_9CYAN|nr:protein-L-isoaspartate(D-aspartate) O-methyltransferase [Lyngbya confervoides]MCM1984342.1 protein-L-isoaspartate(D-aspartate) O-methyltransferase [Lyngbya confervoides BDU141951]